MPYLPSVSAGDPIVITHYPIVAMTQIVITPMNISATFQPQVVTVDGAVVSTGATETLTRSIDSIKNQAILDSIALLANKLKVAYDNRNP